jgi:hypothetical protein
MDARRDTTPETRPAGRTCLLNHALLAMASLMLAGCAGPRAEIGWHGEQQYLAVYRMGTLHSTLPREIPVHSVIAAGEMTLERRGYTVTSTDATDDRGHVVARPRDGRQISKVHLTSRLVDGGTAISIRTYPGGHEQVARDLLERILTRLGQ